MCKKAVPVSLSSCNFPTHDYRFLFSVSVVLAHNMTARPVTHIPLSWVGNQFLPVSWFNLNLSTSNASMQGLRLLQHSQVNIDDSISCADFLL